MGEDGRRDIAVNGARVGGVPARWLLSSYLRDVGVEGSNPFTPTIPLRSVRD
jgi:hypothetical protein